MSAGTTFWYAVVVTLAVAGPAMAVPLATVDASAKDIEAAKPSDIAPAANLPAQLSDTLATAKPDQTEHESKSEAVTDESEPSSVSETDPDFLAVPNASNAGSALPDSGAGTSPPAPTSAGPNVPVHSQTLPYHPVGVQTVKVGPSIPFFMEFFQPFEVFPQFNRRQPPPPPLLQQHQQFPFGASVDPFGVFADPNNPFANPIRSPSFNQLVNAYTNEFRTPEVIIVKPKRQVGLNTTSIPPIPLLMKIILNAFQHEPSDMLASLDKGFPKLENVDDVQEDSDAKPITKTTSKTEIIDGQVVQINETTVKNGHGNHQSFYHFKEIQVLPQVPNVTKIANEENTSVSTDNSETEKVETNEIKQNPSEDTISVAIPADRENFVRKPNEPVPLDDYYQTAAATYYAPYSPYGSWQSVPSASLYHGRPHPSAATVNYNGPPSPAVSANYYNGPPSPVVSANYYNRPPLPMAPANYYNRPPTPAVGPANNHNNRPPRPGTPAPISLHGDTYVNELVAAQQQAAGASTMLPPDVELINVNGKQQQTQGGQFYYNNHHTGPHKFPGRKY